MIYKGSQKESKIYNGGTKIGKIYKGSQLVYQSEKQIQLYGYFYNNSNRPNGMIGGMNTNYPYYYSINDGVWYGTINTISGNLGSSGSTINYQYGGYNYTVTYNKQIIVNGIKLYFYFVTLYDVSINIGIWVMEGSTIGSAVLLCDACNTNSLGIPTSCDNNSMTHHVRGNLITGTRDSSQDKTWTINGVY